MKLIRTLAYFILAFAPFVQAETPYGQQLFKTCLPCHGHQGEGHSQLGAPAIAGMDEWYIVKQLKSFRAGARGKHPKDEAGLRMRPLSRTLANDEAVEAVAKYVSKLPSVLAATTITGHPLTGKKAYESVCAACHGMDAKGNKALNAPSLILTNDWYLLRQLHNFKNGVRAYDANLDPIGAMMAPMAASLDEQSMKDIVFYLQSLR